MFSYLNNYSYAKCDTEFFTPTSTCADKPGKFTLTNGKKKTCNWVSHKTKKRCAKKRSREHCPETCGMCDSIDAFVKVDCGDKCHPIQWPYWMHGCYPESTALHDCAMATGERNGIAFSLQDCYDEPDSNKMYCFIYENKPASPLECQSHVFDKDNCIYGTEKGSFYILDDEYDNRFNDIEDQYVFIKFESIGDVRPSEASIDDIVLEVNDLSNNILDAQASTFDGISWNNGRSPHWSIFSEGTSFMTSYGTLRPSYTTSEHADIFGDREGIWTKVKVRGSIEVLHLTFKLKYGRGNDNLRRFYIAQVGIGEEDDDYKSFKVMSQKIVAASTIEMPGYTGWHEHSATWYSSTWSSDWEYDDA